MKIYDKYFTGIIGEDEFAYYFRSKPQGAARIKRGIWPVYRLRKIKTAELQG